MLTLLLALFALAFGFFATAWLSRRFPERLTKENFQHRRIPSVFGLAYVLAAEVFYGARAHSPQPYLEKLPVIYLLVAVGFGLLGLLDDLSADRAGGGFTGHFRRLFRERKLTTGAVKAIGGGIVALVAGWLLAGPTIFAAVLAALLIALTANTANILDLRPGRALAAFFAGAVAVIVMLICHLGWRRGASAGDLFLFALIAALILYPLDRRGLVMIGDTGANSLGATLGLTFALFFSSAWQIALVVALAALQVFSERRSITRVIEETPLLRGIDRKIGIR